MCHRQNHPNKMPSNRDGNAMVTNRDGHGQ